MARDDEGQVVDPIPVQRKPPEESDRLERSLLPPLYDREGRPSPENEAQARLVHRQHQEALDDRSQWEARLAEWEDAYYDRMPQKDFPWPGAANFHVPLTGIGVDTYKPRLIESILGNDPPIQVSPVGAFNETKRDRTELFLNWQIRVELAIQPTVSESAHLFLIPGTVVAKTTWSVERKSRSYVREFPQDTTVEVILESLFGDKTPQDLEKVGELAWRGHIPTAPRSGGPLDVRFEIKFLGEDDDNGIQVKVEEAFVVEHPRIDLIDPPDFIWPTKSPADIQRMPWCQHRIWMSEDDLRMKARQGRFDHEAVEALLMQTKQPQGDRAQQDAAAYREAKSSTVGEEDQGVSNVRKYEFEVIEDYRFKDVNEDGEAEHLVTWYAKDLSGRILGWDLVDNVYAHGRRPFRVGRAFPVPFRFPGLAFPEIIRGIEDEATAMHNQRVDYGTIQNLPFYFYRASSTLPPFQALLKPGEGIPVDNPAQDILFPKWQGSPAFGQAEESLLYQLYERRTGLTDLTLGRQPNRVGATRTAAGTSQLLNEAGLRQKCVLEEFQRFWTGIFEDVLALDQEYLPPGKEFRVTGRVPEVIKLKDRTEIAGRYDLKLSPITQTMNRQVAREDATVLLQALLNPAIIQTGLVGMKGIQRAYAKFLKAYGEDPDAYLEIHVVPRSPEEELATIVSGGQVKAAPGIDIMAHLQAHQLQLADPMIRSVLKTEGLQALQRLMQDEMQLARAQMMAQALQQQGPGAGKPQGPQAMQAQQGQRAPQPGQPALTPRGGPSGTGPLQ